VKYAFINERSGRYPVAMLCRVTGVSRSPYYAWKARGAKIIPLEEWVLRRRMRELFTASRASLGSRTLAKNLQEEGIEAGRYKVRMRLKAMRLQVKQKRKYKVTTDSAHRLPVAGNVLDRQFNPDKPNQVWGSDISYLWTQEGWIYVAVIIDLYSRRVVGWAIDRLRQAHRELHKLVPEVMAGLRAEAGRDGGREGGPGCAVAPPRPPAGAD